MLKVEESKLSIEPHTISVVTEISQIFSRQGVKAYLVGGFVRDALLGRSTGDIDIAVAADAPIIGQKMADELEGKYVPLDEVNRICRIVIPDPLAPKGRLELDISTLRGNIEHDLAERDFTINALAIELDKFIEDYPHLDLIDPFGGLQDINRKIIRAVSESVFEQDAVRLLRGVRLAAELGFSMESGTESSIRRHSRLITQVSGERIREELLRLLAVPGLLSYLDELGLLTSIIPEMEKARGVEQPKEHYWDVFNHLIRTADAADFLLRQGDWSALGEPAKKEALSASPWSETVESHFNRPVSYGSNRRLLLKIAALLHDIAKPQTKIIEETGRVRFFGHPQEGAAITVNILERLRFSTREITLVESMVRHHMRPAQMSQEGLPSRRAIYRFFRDTGDAGIDTLFLSLADHLASRGPELDMAGWREHTRIVQYVIEKHFESETVTAPRKLINGHDLIQVFGLEPGPGVGELLEAVREAQAAGEITTREEALFFIERKVRNKAG